MVPSNFCNIYMCFSRQYL